jgi:metal transporter CNNM
MTDLGSWLGIALCLSQAAALSGLNLAVFSLSLLRLEAAAGDGDEHARRVLALRRRGHLTLTTILWANVAINVLLTLLAGSVLSGVAAFLFSTVVITILGELLPQAYFSRHALVIAARLAPLLRVYQVLLWPLAWPSACILDAWIGSEHVPWFRERELERVLEEHARARSEISEVEARGAINFLALDDLAVGLEGEPLDPLSVVPVEFEVGRPHFPRFARDAGDPFLQRLAASGKKWVVLVDGGGEPRLMVNAPALLRAALFGQPLDVNALCHRPLVVRDANLPLGQVLSLLTVHPQAPGDDVVDEDVILVWVAGARRIITGSDLLGRLLRRIARPVPAATAT